MNDIDVLTMQAKLKNLEIENNVLKTALSLVCEGEDPQDIRDKLASYICDPSRLVERIDRVLATSDNDNNMAPGALKVSSDAADAGTPTAPVNKLFLERQQQEEGGF